MAFRRCISNCAASTLGLVLETNLSHQTIAKYEVNLRAAILASARLWHQRMQDVMAGYSGGQWTAAPAVQIHCSRGDATNAAVWQRSKLHVLEVDSLYSPPLVHTLAWDAVLPTTTSRKMLSDLQVVGEKSGNTLHALVLQQVISTGATAALLDGIAASRFPT